MDGTAENTDLMLLITFYEMCYREAYPEYKDIQVAVVSDEAKIMEDPVIKRYLKKGYHILDINAFGTFAEGHLSSAVILAK